VLFWDGMRALALTLLSRDERQFDSFADNGQYDSVIKIRALGSDFARQFLHESLSASVVVVHVEALCCWAEGISTVQELSLSAA